MSKIMKTTVVAVLSVFLLTINSFAQKPAWVDNPGVFASENFVGVGVAKDSKVDKARAKAEKKAIAGIDKILKKKYPKSDVKKAMTSVKIESYWQDPVNKYYYALALLPIENIDKAYATQKKADKTRATAMSALKMLNEQTSDPDVVIMKVDDESLESENAEGGMESEMLEEKPAEAKKQVSAVSSTSSVGSDYGSTDFSSKSFGNFKWTDQDQNSKYSLLGDGNLTVNVVTDEWWDPKEGNKHAPRVELANVKGNFTAVTKVKTDWTKSNVGFGICAHNGKQSVMTKIFYNGSYAYLEGFANDIELPRTEKYIDPFKGFAYLKLVRSGYSWTAYYSTIDDDWVEIASFESEFPENCNVGVVFLNTEGTTAAMKMEYLKVSQ